MLSEKFKLYTLDEVAAIFPGKSTKKVVEAVAQESGIYIDFDGAKLFSEHEVRRLIAHMTVNSLRGKPAADAPGFLCVIGSVNPDADVGLFWAPTGRVDPLVREVQEVAQWPCQLLHWVRASYGEYEQLLASIKREKVYGHWYANTEPVKALLRKLTAQYHDETNEEKEGTQ